MDPNTALETLRELMPNIRTGDEEPFSEDDAADAFEALDEWLTKGGFLPTDWRRTDLSFAVPDEAWTPNEALAIPLQVLQTRITINGLAMHLEAFEIKATEFAPLQTTTAQDYANDFAAIHEAVHGDGPFQTTIINGREYVLVATPHC